MTIAVRIRDWWRGYSDADAQSWGAKYEGPFYPGRVFRLTEAEHRAKTAWEKAEAAKTRKRGRQ